MIDDLIANAEPWSADRWCSEWEKSESSRNAMFLEIQKLKSDLASAYESVTRWQAEAAEGVRQVEASDKLYRDMCKERNELKEDVRLLGEAILNLRHAKGRHNTGVAYERLLAEFASFQLKHPIR